MHWSVGFMCLWVSLKMELLCKFTLKWFLYLWAATSKQSSPFQLSFLSFYQTNIPLLVSCWPLDHISHKIQFFFTTFLLLLNLTKFLSFAFTHKKQCDFLFNLWTAQDRNQTTDHHLVLISLESQPFWKSAGFYWKKAL